MDKSVQTSFLGSLTPKNDGDKPQNNRMAQLLRQRLFTPSSPARVYDDESLESIDYNPKINSNISPSNPQNSHGTTTKPLTDITQNILKTPQHNQIQSTIQKTKCEKSLIPKPSISKIPVRASNAFTNKQKTCGDEQHQGPSAASKREGLKLSTMDTDLINADIRPEFVAVHRLDDSQVVRSIDFHPSGEVYAVGSNSRTLRICSYPADHELRHLSPHHVATQPRVLFKFLQVHRGSIYCVGFNANGNLLATGSNDQTIHVVRYNSTTHCPEGDEYKLTMHDGTVRDLCFIDDVTNGSSLLISAGGGNNKIYVTDCDTITPFQSLTGHTSTVLSLHTWGGANFVSGSADRTIRFWDLRTRGCTSIVSAPPTTLAAKGPGAPVNVVRVDPTGKLLVSGHSDSTCMLYDIRAARVIQTMKPHFDEIRTISFSPKSYYLLTAGYDGRVVLSDLQGDLTLALPSVCVAEHSDKIVQAKWHPTDFTFVTTSADKTATLWALPQ